MIEEADEIITEFLVESHENLDALDRELVALEGDPGNRERIASIFRTIHTIKGTSGFLAFNKLEKIAHVGENLLSKLRDGEMDLNPPITSGLLAMVDAIRTILGSVEASGGEGDHDFTHVVDTLATLLANGGAAVDHDHGPSAEAAPEPAATVALPPAPPPAFAAPEAPTSIEPVAHSAPASPIANAPVGQSIPAAAAAPSTHPEPAAHAAEPHAAEHAEGKGGASVSDSSIRVDVSLLDKLMNLVGELVLARNQVLQYTDNNKDPGIHNTSQRLNLITSELQENIMKTRMQPIGSVWSKFPRIVRDLSMQCGKQVKLEMEGKETDLDRTIVEAIKDPLTHIVRNSVDHGIETPEKRIAAGKPAAGTLLLRAFHEGGKVNIEIIDDGGGIDPERVKAKALQKGIITAERAARMSERELVNLVFAPGFSTAEKVTNVSGRGVGMDVVRTNIEKIGGSVDIQSRPGKGTVLKIKIPLTLAIIPALMVTCRGDRYAIPQVSLLELVRLEPQQAAEEVEFVHGSPVYRLRGNLLPLVDLARALGVAREDDPVGDGTVNIVVLQADDQHFGLVVDGVIDTVEIVVKPLGKELKGIAAFAGATILGDGRVALILDVLGLAQSQNVISQIKDRGLVDSSDRDTAKANNSQTLLLFRVGEGGRMALPLDMVARLEEFPLEHVEIAAGEEVVQYRGEILSLVRLSSLFGTPSVPNEETKVVPVVVYTWQGKSVGLVVDNILDIVDEDVSVIRKRARNGTMGSAVIQGKVTDLLDIEAVIRAVDPSFYDMTATEAFQ